MEPSIPRHVAEELREVLPALIEEAKQRDPSTSEVPPGADGWLAYAPIGDQSRQYLPATPWGNVELLDVTCAGPLVVVAFRWRPDDRLFAHVTDLSTSVVPETAAMEIELAMTRMLVNTEFPRFPKTLIAGDVTVVTGG